MTLQQAVCVGLTALPSSSTTSLILFTDKESKRQNHKDWYPWRRVCKVISVQWWSIVSFYVVWLGHTYSVDCGGWALSGFLHWNWVLYFFNCCKYAFMHHQMCSGASHQLWYLYIGFWLFLPLFIVVSSCYHLYYGAQPCSNHKSGWNKLRKYSAPDGQDRFGSYSIYLYVWYLLWTWSFSGGCYFILILSRLWSRKEIE